MGQDRVVPLDHDRCYDALSSRDRRFDGRFWVGVRTTGIYCRPICPSRTPKATNVDFFAHPAAAEDAGFRPCRRCRPDAQPGSADWDVAGDIVRRALELVEAGALDDGDVDALARRLHVGARHLRRLFAERLGTSPDAVARTRRAHLVHRLLLDSDLRVADLAFAAGFGSVRQCNDVVRTVYGASPTELRRRGRDSAGAGRAGVPGRTDACALRLATRQPFDLTPLLEWFAIRAVAGMEDVTAEVYRRRVAVGDDVGEVAVRAADGGIRASISGLPPTTPLTSIVDGCRRLFDLDADPVAVDDHLGGDPVLAPSVRARPGIRVPGCWTGFEAAVRGVLGQQVSVRAATTLAARVVSEHGRHGSFPTPEALLDAPLEQLGVIGSRARTIRHLAGVVQDGTLDLEPGADPAERRRGLLACPGIGPWTVAYVELRTGDPDAFPAGDLHLRRMLGADDVGAAEAAAEHWRPWRAHAAMHLWTMPAPLTQTPKTQNPMSQTR